MPHFSRCLGAGPPLVSVGTAITEAAPPFAVFERWALRASRHPFIRHRGRLRPQMPSSVVPTLRKSRRVGQPQQEWRTQKIVKVGRPGEKICRSRVDSPPPRSTSKWSRTAHWAPRNSQLATRNFLCPARSRLLYKSSGPDTVSAQHSILITQGEHHGGWPTFGFCRHRNNVSVRPSFQLPTNIATWERLLRE